jgi:CRISPR-associated endonuclease/helicase Cas3
MRWPPGHARYFSATVDQFLSFMANRYSGICMLPIVADG